MIQQDTKLRKSIDLAMKPFISMILLDVLFRITYPEVSDGPHSSIKPTYTYTYDLFDNPISVTDPKGRDSYKII